MAVVGTDIRLVTRPSEHEAVCVTLSRAFQNEEACAYIFPNPATREQRLLKMFRIIVKGDAAAGCLYQTSGNEAVTLWRAPGQASGSALNFAASLVPFLFALRGGIGRGLEISNAIERHHPKSPFWYLHFAGCEPQAQGKGFGGAAIRAGLARADADHQPAYLETASPRNLPLYAGLGFVVQDEWQIAGGPKFWGMLRPARLLLRCAPFRRDRIMPVHDFTVSAGDGTEQPLSDFAGKPMLIVNTASKCGFTPQYEGLGALHRKYGDRVSILAFPCNQFGGQEPGSAEEIANFCSLKYDVTFPVMAKIDVNGAAADPLYQYLKAARPGLLGSQSIKWNFTKFLVDKAGHVVSRHAPTDKPESLTGEIDALL